MAIFKKKNVSQAVVFSVPTAEQEREQMLARAEIFLKIEIPAALTAIRRYRKLVKGVPHVGASIRAHLDQIMEIITELDMTKFQLEQQAEFYHVLGEILPTAINNVVDSQRKHETPWEERARIGEAVEIMKKLLVGQIHPSYVKTPVTTHRETPFPALAVVNPAITNLIEDLKTKWQQAYARVTTVEDRFFLDQIALSYLPDLWRMYQPFAQTANPLQLEAQKLLGEQVTLLLRGTEETFNRGVDNALNELKAHKIFLVHKLQQTEIEQVS